MIFIEYKDIPGNSTAEGYEKQIRVDSFQFGIGRGITMEPGNLSNREATRPSLSEVTFTHKTDSSATLLFREAVSGSAGKEVKIHFVQTGKDKLVEFMTYTLSDVLVSGYSLSADGDSDPIESVSLSYSKIEVKYQDFDKTNAGASQKVAGYDLTVAKAL